MSNEESQINRLAYKLQTILLRAKQKCYMYKIGGQKDKTKRAWTNNGRDMSAALGIGAIGR